MVLFHVAGVVPKDDGNAAIAAGFLQEVRPVKAIAVSRHRFFVELAGFGKAARLKFANGDIGIFVLEAI